MGDVAFDLNLLRYLNAIVRESSVSRAADQLGVTQPAVSAALKRLRQLFDDPILVRSGQVMTATPRAVAMVERVGPLLAETQELLDASATFDPARSRRSFTLMGSDYAQFFVLPRLIAQLQRLGSQIAIEQRPANPSKVLPWMESGQVDLGIGYLASPPPSLRSRLLFGDSQVCVMRQGHPALRGGFTLERYADVAHIVVSPGGAGIWSARIDALLRARSIERRIALTLPSYLSMPYVVARTDHVATVPRRFAEYFASLLPLAIVETPLELPAFEIGLFWHERVHQDRPNVWLRQQVVDAIAELAG